MEDTELLRWCPWVSRAPSSLFVFLPSAFFILAVRSVSLVIICPLFSVRSWILGPSVGLASPVLRGHLLSEGASHILCQGLRVVLANAWAGGRSTLVAPVDLLFTL